MRKLATRARQHVEQRRPRFQTTREQRDELAQRFFAAAEQGDLAGLEALLAHDVELTGDGGGKAPAIARPLRGRSRVARLLVNWSAGPRAFRACRCALSRSTAAPERSTSTHEQRLIGVLALDIAGGQITSIRAIVNPDKLAHLGPVGDVKSLLRSAR